MPGTVGIAATRPITNASEVVTGMQRLLLQTALQHAPAPYVFDQMAIGVVVNSAGRSAQSCYRSDDFCVWIDGEFYNASELASSEQIETDAALLAHLIREGALDDALPKINGFFSAVIFDVAENRLFFMSDRYGLGQIYVHQTPTGIAWASEMKAMLAVPEFSPQINVQAIDDFLGVGYLLGRSTWFEGVEILDAATIATFDLNSRRMTKRRYWSYEDNIESARSVNEDEVAEELARLFDIAVRRRLNPIDEIGVYLSGGLDSRLIVAALPETSSAVPVVTFGLPNCADIEIARQVCELRNIEHHVFNFQIADDWLTPRMKGVWWTDGQNSILNMHRLPLLPEIAPLFAVNLNGFLGDAVIGGSYGNNHEMSRFWKYHNRGRRWMRTGLRLGQAFCIERLPFMDNDFFDFAQSLPAELHQKSRIYRKMLLRCHPAYFSNIPWQKTGRTIGFDVTRNRGGLLGKLQRRISNNRTVRPGSFVDYPNWLRQPVIAERIDDLLGSDRSLCFEYVNKRYVQSNIDRHRQGENRAKWLGAFLTLEIWLRQVFDASWRPTVSDAID